MLNYIKFLPSTILNRLRGTGSMFYLNINGNILYALYIFILTALLSLVFNYAWEWSFLALVLYIVGEASSWGKWVGYISSPIEEKVDYNNADGRSFPFIHYIANFLIDQTKHYKAYCLLALSLRGIYWWLPLYTLLGWLFGQIIIGMALGLIIGLLFSVAAILSTKYDFTYLNDYTEYFKNKTKMDNTIVYECKNNWERQEVIYGAMQEVTLWLLIIISFILKLW